MRSVRPYLQPRSRAGVSLSGKRPFLADLGHRQVSAYYPNSQHRPTRLGDRAKKQRVPASPELDSRCAGDPQRGKDKRSLRRQAHPCCATPPTDVGGALTG